MAPDERTPQRRYTENSEIPVTSGSGNTRNVLFVYLVTGDSTIAAADAIISVCLSLNFMRHNSMKRDFRMFRRYCVLSRHCKPLVMTRYLDTSLGGRSRSRKGIHKRLTCLGACRGLRSVPLSTRALGVHAHISTDNLASTMYRQANGPVMTYRT